ncbi:vesicle-associated membrane protein 4-like isoform X2 [Hydractinia symbiolongicarpus]|uniref:vesicle-associated membrane protein 4-like isoform X2 n=1 Tax=Hydractinia symbiolongicarpus TaxID=13093 RepID=UPI00254D02DB|nr:vesicle-associated membrane protein 4-like isoform X2 [Hydractinia symbiolongicarpus]
MVFGSRSDTGYTRVPLLSGNDDDSEEELYERSNSPKKKPDTISKVKHELEGAMNVMRTNLGKVLDRGERLEDLEAKSESFEMNAFQFKNSSTKLQNRLWWQNCKMKAIFGSVVAAVLLVVIISIVVKSKK